MILHVKGCPDRALCCQCRHLYEPKPSELRDLEKPGRQAICPPCYRRASEQLDRREPVYLKCSSWT